MPIIDCHAFHGALPESVRQASLEEIEQVLGSCKIGSFMLTSAMGENGDFRRGNEALQQAIEGKDHAFGYVSVSAHYPEESAEEVKRLAQPQFRGVKLPRAAAGPRIASEGFRAVLHAARRYGVPILVDTVDEADVRDVVDLAREFGTIRFVLGGMAEDDWETAVRACEEVLNTSLEIGSLSADRDKIRDAVSAVGPKRVLFGSHFPRLHPMYVLGMVLDSAVDDRDRERILYRNAVELFDLEPGDGGASAAEEEA